MVMHSMLTWNALDDSVTMSVTTDVMGRAHTAVRLCRIVQAEVSKVPNDMSSRDQMNGVDKALRDYYAAAKLLHLEDIALGESNATNADGTRDLDLGKSQPQLGEGFFKKSSPRRRKNEKGCDMMTAKCVESSLRRRSNFPTYHAARAKANIKCKGCLSSADKERMKEGLGPDMLVRKLASKVGSYIKKSLTLVFGWLKQLAGMIMQVISRIFKKIASFMAKHIPSLLESAAFKSLKGFVKTWQRCSSPTGSAKRVLCSEPDRAQQDEHGMITCDNGGGEGRHWLYTDRLNMRTPPATWIKEVPDSSECQKPGDWPPKACPWPPVSNGTEDKEYCSQRLPAEHDGTSPE